MRRRQDSRREAYVCVRTWCNLGFSKATVDERVCEVEETIPATGTKSGACGSRAGVLVEKFRRLFTVRLS